MKSKSFLTRVFLLLSVFFFIQPLWALPIKADPSDIGFPKVVYFIRHGEKPKDERADTGNLVCLGLLRSLKIPGVFKPLGVNVIVAPKPNFAESSNEAMSGQRSFETIIPFAVFNNLPIYAHVGKDDVASVAKELSRDYKNMVVLVAWEHKNIAKILEQMGVKNPPVWSDEDFDSIYKMTFSPSTNEPLLDTSLKQQINNSPMDPDVCKKLVFP
jgi:hypothetical protein